MKPLEGRTISILGLGASGAAAAHLALIKGGDVYVSDSRAEPSAATRAAELRNLGARVELGGHDLERVASADTLVVSPGIPPDAPVLQALQARGRRWVSEPEFAFRFLQGPLIAVTGTNGKTTTAAMTAHLLEEGGIRVGLGGNIGARFGPPVSDLALLDPAPDWFVVEVSSFQLADIVDFAPGIGVLTNLAPDHLDRYHTVADYYADKANLFRNATSRSRWVLNGDQPQTEELAGSAPGLRTRFSLQGDPRCQARRQDTTLILELTEGKPREIMAESDLPTLGSHNAANALAALLTAGLVGMDPGVMGEAMSRFQPLPHRLEPVGDRHGLRWVNDSKATNVAATAGALESLEGPLVLLLGGKDKGEALEPLRQALHSGVRAVILYGEARERFRRALEGAVLLEPVTGSFEDAVTAARLRARPGDMLLLSPACSSFDMFENYEARGNRFRALARGEA